MPLCALTGILSVSANLSSQLSTLSLFQLNATPAETTVKVVGLSIHNNTVSLQPFTVDQAITGVAVSGTIIKESPDYLVRIILTDNMGREHLVLESYEEINSSDTISFNNYCEETFLLNNIVPDSLKVIASGAKVQLDKVAYSKAGLFRTEATNVRTIQDSIRKQQIRSVVDRINAYNHTNNKLWMAAITPLSLKSYEVKKRALGVNDKVSSEGLEYYGGGIFEMGSHKVQKNTVIKTVQQSSYVDSFDWRNRHGKNWITSVKFQGNSGLCSAFASIGCLEAITNLYFNDTINLDLSEQEVSWCCGAPDPYNGMSFIAPLNYLCNHGVCDEAAYPFDDRNHLTCQSDSITPNENVSIEGYSLIPNSPDSVKKALIKKGPLVGGINYYDQWNTYHAHAMTLVGYGTIHAGDTIRMLDSMWTYFCVPANDPRIGETYWIYKNSYGLSWPWHPEHQGYYYLLFNNQSNMDNCYAMELPIQRMNHTNAEIICEDADGDGYYNWGIGPKPANCPVGIPNTEDGDDSDSLAGPMNGYGYLENLNPDDRDTVYIDTDEDTHCDQNIYNHIVVRNNAHWTIWHNITFHNGAKVFVRNGSTVEASFNAQLKNAQIIMENPSKMSMNGNSKIIRRQGTDFVVPLGSSFKQEQGRIE